MFDQSKIIGSSGTVSHSWQRGVSETERWDEVVYGRRKKTDKGRWSVVKKHVADFNLDVK